jgi:hypothetical protein
MKISNPQKRYTCAGCAAEIAAAWGWIFIEGRSLDLCAKCARTIRYAPASEQARRIARIVEQRHPYLFRNKEAA